jgi:hypothetical protein
VEEYELIKTEEEIFCICENVLNINDSSENSTKYNEYYVNTKRENLELIMEEYGVKELKDSVTDSSLLDNELENDKKSIILDNDECSNHENSMKPKFPINKSLNSTIFEETKNDFNSASILENCFFFFFFFFYFFN